MCAVLTAIDKQDLGPDEAQGAHGREVHSKPSKIPQQNCISMIKFQPQDWLSSIALKTALASKITSCVETLASKTGSLSLIPRVYMEREN